MSYRIGWASFASGFYGGLTVAAVLWGMYRDLQCQHAAAERYRRWLDEGRWLEQDDDAAYEAFIDAGLEGR